METQQRRLREAPSRSWVASRGTNFSRGKRYGNKREVGQSLREMLVQQCIVSGLILFAALAISFLPFGFAGDLRSYVKHTLSQEGSVEGLLNIAGGITDRYESFKSSVKLLFEKPDGSVDDQWRDNETPMGIDYSPGVGIPLRDNAIVTDDVPLQPDTSAMIDENVLKIINTGEFYEADESGKKP